MPLPIEPVSPERRRRDPRYHLLMALDHLLEGAQLYGQASREAMAAGNGALAEFFGALERLSRRQAQTARDLLDGEPPAGV